MNSQFEWRHQWDTDSAEDMDAHTSIDEFPDGMTLQAPAEEADINVIIKRFGITDGSRLPYWNSQAGIYGDISEFPQDPTEIANIMHEAKMRFAILPADVRQKFATPEELFEFLDNDANKEEARRLGLLKPIEPPPPAAPPPAGPITTPHD